MHMFASFPSQADPKLKGKIQPDEIGAIFGNIKPLTMLHTSLLKQLENIGTRYTKNETDY